MLKPICVQCQRFYRPKKTGVYFIESMQKPGVTRWAPGRAAPELWQPYKIWVGDLWHCPDCGHELISGVGAAPLNEHYLPDFTAVLERTGADWLHVKDC